MLIREIEISMIMVYAQNLRNKNLIRRREKKKNQNR